MRRPLAKRVTGRTLPQLSKSAVLFGSFLPDVPLILLTFIFLGVDWARGVSLTFSNDPDNPSLTWRLFDDWFFNNPWVISAQNFFHSPLLVAVFIALSFVLWRRGVRGAGWCFWLMCSAMLHTLVDIPLHHSDGPLLLYPLNWTWRFASPVSYWDPEHFGREFFVLEHLLDLGLIVILALPYLIRWRQRRVKA